MERDDRALYVISVAAELAGVHPQTLRIYERKGLIEPQRTEGRSRRYSERDIALLRRIQELTNAGVSLAGVQKVLDLEHELSAAQARIDAAQSRIDALQRVIEQSHADAAEAVAGVHRSYTRALVPMPPRTVVSLRRGN